MMKKALSLILALAMALSLAACGGSKTETPADNGGSTADNTSAEPTQMTLILRGGTYAEALKASLPDFEAEHNVKIDVQELSFDDLHTGIALDAVNSTGAYDLCMVDGSWMAEFTENNVLANLSEMGYSFDDDIIPATTTICKVDDNIYLAPFFGNVTVMLYNKQLIADAGYTPEDITTFEDLKVIAQKTKDAGKTGFLIRGGSADNIVSDFIPHLLVHGGWVIDENNQPTVDTPEFKAAMQEYLDLYALGGTMDKDDIVAAIDGGTAALGQAWPGWYVPTADTNANYTVIPTKLNDSDTPKNTSMYGVWCIGIPNNAPHKDLALELLEYVMSPEVQLASIEVGGVPCRTSCLLNEDVLATYPQYETVCAALQTGVYRPVIAEWTQFTNILGTEMDNIIQGTKTIDQGLADAQTQLVELMNG
ncbi:MAG: extracellular solute-binding protein [Oscillibacter sp.]|jgi:multiple sugar transport system substrate-binding protein|uniref:extracellular solute-binding protein n=1 Tax=uncultured Dysosmobacter sp. TaxID=2591384 RepID=UPI0026718D77|nr:extracellular solute-binding protein [Dysosmobacter sp.]MDD6408797.1 extracellular solute-binding protein [Oscillibacter sp.]MDY3867454.1 extracellular solute-binding protein [Dysosmobacter sp.]